MQQLPIVELRIRDMGDQVAAMVALRKEELVDLISQGIERTLSGAPETIIAQAMNEANKAVAREIESYFSYGPGRDAIKAAMTTAMEPIRKALSK